MLCLRSYLRYQTKALKECYALFFLRRKYKKSDYYALLYFDLYYIMLDLIIPYYL